MSAPIFISYQRRDAEYARLLADRLNCYGADVWWDGMIAPDADWRESIVAGLDRARIFVLLHSKAAEQSDEIRKELAVASADRKTLVAVRLDDIAPSGAFRYEMAAINWIDAWADPDARLDALARQLAALAPTASAQAVAEAIDARPIRASLWARLSGNIWALLLLTALALCAALAAQAAGGEGLAAARVDGSIDMTTVINAVLAMAIAAPLVIVRFLMEPPAMLWQWVLLVAVLALIAGYVLLARLGWRGWQRRRAVARGGG